MSQYSRQTPRIVYEKPALREVVATLFLAGRGEYPGLVGRCETEFPELFAETSTLDYTVIDNTGDSLPPRPTVRLKSQDGRFIFQHGPGVVSFHSLAPYVGFETFLKHVSELTEFIDATYPELRTQNVNLLYFNSFDFSEEHIHLGEYFNITVHVPRVPSVRPTALKNFRVTTEVEYEELERTVEIGLFSYLERQVGLSLECWPTTVKDWDRTEMLAWLESSHNFLGDVFESTVSDRTRQLLRRNH